MFWLLKILLKIESGTKREQRKGEFFILLIFIHGSYVHGSITIQIKVKCGRILRTAYPKIRKM